MPTRHTTVSLALLCFLLSAPAWPGKMVEAPPPPPMPEGLSDADEMPARLEPATVETQSLGQVLYENSCTACHESAAHISARRAVKSLSALRAEVAGRADGARLQWRADEVEAVVGYLNSRHYKFR